MTDTYIVFELEDAAYGIRSAEVQYLEVFEQVTPVPNTASSVDGVVFSRGRVVPAVNLRARFGLPRQPPTPRTRLIFLQLAERVVALVVDAAREFRRIDPAVIKCVDQTLVGIAGNYVTGVATVAGRSVLLLDLAAVLTFEETRVPPSPAGPEASALR